jgi:hypothetical protein
MAKQLKDSFEKLNSVIVQANQVGMKVTSSTVQIAAAGKQLSLLCHSPRIKIKK